MTRRSPLLLAVGVAAIILAACGTGPPDHVRIGIAAPLTGPRAFIGQELLTGARIAVDDLNASGGLLGQPVELVVVDDADLTTLPGHLADLAERARVSAVIGPEAPGIVLGPRSPLARRGVPALLPTAFAGDLDEATTLVVRTIPSARAQAQALGEWLRDVRGIDRLGLLVADPAEGDLALAGLQAGFADADVTVAATVTADGGAADLRPAVAALRDRASDVLAVLIWAPPAPAAAATRAVRELGWDVQLAAPVSALVGEYRTLAAEAAEGVVVASPFFEEWLKGDLVPWLVRYHVREGMGLLPQLDTLVLDLPLLAVAAADAVTVVATAVEAVGSREPDRVAAAIASDAHVGLAGTYRFAGGEAWDDTTLSIARFHRLAVTFDVDPEWDAERMRTLWEAQVRLDMLPESLQDGPLQALVDRLVASAGPPPTYVPPLPAPGPVGRPDD